MTDSPNEVWTGGCQCGAVRYRIKGSLGKAGICHCRMCQKAFGNFGAAVPAISLDWTRGLPSVFRSSPIVGRGYCAACGTPLYMREDGDSDYEIAVGCLDNPNAIDAMTEQVGVESKVKWFDGMPGLPAQRTEETRSPEDLAKLKSLQHPDHDTEHWPWQDKRK